MKKIVLIIFFVLIAGCSSRSTEINTFENIYEFEELPKPCRADRNCKLADLSYVGCGDRNVFVYSNLVIYGENEEKMLKLSEQIVVSEREQIKLEECILVVPKPPRGICWKKQCELIYTHRK